MAEQGERRPPLTFRVQAAPIIGAESNHERGQFLLTDRNSFAPNTLGCLYGAHLHLTTVKANTAKKTMEAVASLMSWAEERAPTLELQMAHGEPPTKTQLLSFTRWLKERSCIGTDKIAPEAAETYNSTVRAVRRFVEWALIEGNSGNSGAMNAALESNKRIWQQIKLLPVSTTKFADDLEDDELLEVETFLRHACKSASGDNRVAMRDYLMWHLAIEYGLRIGEILALRVQDLPSLTNDVLQIVRTDHRGDLVDPRGSRAPKVKTLGRDLGYFFRKSAFPELFSTYQISHRWVWARRKSGKHYQKTRFPHPYLLINTTDGSPLSIASAMTLAQCIRDATGVNFTWHKARHAFFNRAYVAMDALEDPYKKAERRAGLVYWGGWSSEDSLDIYTQTARRNKARRGSFALAGEHDRPEWYLK